MNPRFHLPRGVLAAMLLTSLAVASPASAADTFHPSSRTTDVHRQALSHQRVGESSQAGPVTLGTAPTAPPARTFRDEMVRSSSLRGVGAPPLDALNRHRQAAARRAGQEDPEPIPPDLLTECRHHAEAATPKGWLRNRGEHCWTAHFTDQLHRVYLNPPAPPRRELLGKAEYDVWVIGLAHNGERQVDYIMTMQEVVLTPAASDPSTWTYTMKISCQPTTGWACVGPARQQRADTINGWRLSNFFDVSYTSPNDTGDTAYKLVPATVRVDTVMDPHDPQLEEPLPTQSPYATAKIRFDSAGAVVGKHHGVAFPDARATLTIKSDATRRESARHIFDALRNQQVTFPSWVGKSVPGETEALHRLTDEDKKKENRRKAIEECKNIWGDYAKAKDANGRSILECDEYPFAATYEGAAKGDRRFSVRPILARDNGRVGNDLQEFYQIERILDNEPFYVRVIL